MTLEHKIPPPIVMGLCALIAWGLAHIAPLQLTGTGSIAFWLTIALAVSGIALATIAVREFHLRNTTINPLKPQSSSELVTDGLYRFSRNPMYLAMAMVLLAWIVWLGNIASLLAAAAFIAFMNRFQIRPEESALLANFGEEYRAYCQQVRRWL